MLKVLKIVKKICKKGINEKFKIDKKFLEASFKSSRL
jgi:hypothetical protein